VATGYEAVKPQRAGLREPAGEPRVTRTREREPARSTDVEVPEFIPKF
jgi:cell division protein FtsZ